MSNAGFKEPKTIQELRENKATIFDSDFIEATGRHLIVRAKRFHLPTSYDDIHLSVEERCWKRHRYTQYR
jgi:hypothetical protein